MNKHKPFTALSRRQRRASTIRIKNLIHRERLRCGGIFYDDCDIPAAIASGRWTWSDILFTSRDPATYWNAEIITAGLKFKDCVEQAAFDEAWAMLNADEQERETTIETVPTYNAAGKIINHRQLPRHEITYPQFDGLTWLEYIDKRTQEIARDNPPAVHCGYRILPGYRAGIGLQMVVDAPTLTVEVIEAAIADFRARGEREWATHQSDTDDEALKAL
ncbi:hypothetical protein IIK97_004058 [Salmonella enterica subsp. enterica serovar Nigeria]|nr:hypothetical protein [Salmonella enterica subsp. enterica serovar Nigeria]